jgi:hypothetical protein
VNWNPLKKSEMRQISGLNLGRRKSDIDNHVKSDDRLSSLKTTLINMINTSKQSNISIDKALTGFYKEINKTIKRN